jgi:hypothetical protein
VRAIKFRARRKDGTLIGFERFEKAHWQCMSIEDFNRGVETWSSGTFASAIKEQFTGLRDKRGVEIYEGDIIQYPTYRYRVVWDIENAGFALQIAPNELRALNSTDRCEVIGNAHENPDLLTAEGGQ